MLRVDQCDKCKGWFPPGSLSQIEVGLNPVDMRISVLIPKVMYACPKCIKAASTAKDMFAEEKNYGR